MTVFFERVVQLRKMSGETQAEMADRVGVCTMTISRYERCQEETKVTLDVMEKIADAYHVSLDWLAGRTDALPVISVLPFPPKDTEPPYPYNLLKMTNETYHDKFPKYFDIEMLDEDQKKGFEYVMSLLNERKKEIVSMVFEEGLTAAQAGESLGITRSRVQQILHDVYRFIRHHSIYIVKGYNFASGQLEQQAQKRYLEQLEQIYTKYDNALGVDRDTGEVAGLNLDLRDIEVLDLDAKTYRLLKRNGVDDIADLMELTDADVKRMRGAGEHVIQEIHRAQQKVKSNDISVKKLMNFPSQAMTWTNVIDKYPKPRKPVLVYTRDDSVQVALWSGVAHRWRGAETRQDIEEGWVTHWRELPSAPRKEC